MRSDRYVHGICDVSDDVLGSIQNLAGFYNKLITNLSAAERIFEILDTPAEVADKPGVTELPPIKGEVTFDHVSFAYSDDPDTLVLKMSALQRLPVRRSHSSARPALERRPLSI